jgi:ABC-2 type transport system ATP-binding protein
MLEKSEKNPALRAIKLSKRYEDDVLALDNLNLAVQAGQIYMMLGANGAGKTTTINLFLNFIEPTDGEAQIEGICAHREPLKAKARVAYVSENVMLYRNFTALQNMDYFTRLGGKTDCSADDYHRVLLRAGLEEASHRKKLKDFSKGMIQKCGIAIAILKDAPTILLDEPTSGLDPKAGHEFIRLLKELRDEGKAILMSTHDIFRAKQLADIVGIMKSGKLVMEKSREEIADENLEKLYLEFMSGND